MNFKTLVDFPLVYIQKLCLLQFKTHFEFPENLGKTRVTA